MSQKPKSGQHF